jgi:threonine dehydratase
MMSAAYERTMTVPNFHDVLAARPLVSRHLPKTPLVKSWPLSRLLGCDYFVKCENLQPVGAFKVRGGVNLVGTLGHADRRAGIISASTGNHGQSLAFAGGLFGVRVIIYAPAEGTNPLKLQAMRELGAEVRLHGRNFDEAREEVERVAAAEGLRYVHSANEPALIAGVGTMGLEIFEDLADADVILVPVGAGSGACGIGLVAKHLRPQTQVIGVQSESAPGVWRGWKEGHLEPYPTMTSRHEGIATRVPFELTNTILRDVLDDFILVADDEIDDAIRLLAEKAKLIAEGAGAASLAAAMKLRDRLAGKKVVGMLSGGNIPLDRFCDTVARRDAAR